MEHITTFGYQLIVAVMFTLSGLSLYYMLVVVPGLKSENKYLKERNQTLEFWIKQIDSGDFKAAYEKLLEEYRTMTIDRNEKGKV